MINHNGPENVSAVEAKAKNMNLALTFYDHASSPLIDTEIVTLIGGMIAVIDMRARMFCRLDTLRQLNPFPVASEIATLLCCIRQPIIFKISSVTCRIRLLHGTIMPSVHFNFSTKTSIGEEISTSGM